MNNTIYTIWYGAYFTVETTDPETAQWESENGAYVTAQTGGA